MNFVLFIKVLIFYEAFWEVFMEFWDYLRFILVTLKLYSLGCTVREGTDFPSRLKLHSEITRKEVPIGRPYNIKPVEIQQ
jgi:hypothetical protein